jgi:hypothetical protein
VNPAQQLPGSKRLFAKIGTESGQPVGVEIKQVDASAHGGGNPGIGRLYEGLSHGCRLSAIAAAVN